MTNLYLKLKTLFLENNNFTDRAASKVLNMSQPNFSTKLKAGTLRYTEIEKILDSLGYEIIWQKRDSESRPTLSGLNIGMEGSLKSAEATEHSK